MNAGGEGAAPVDPYTHGHDPSVVARHARRSAEHEAAYLLPHLRPGMRLLDVGCGPGTITSGLARAVAPGEVIGIDVAPEVLEQAHAHALEAGTLTVRFEVATVYDLPYAAASFDVVHAHQVLQHLARPVEALVAMRRVLRPGGIVAVRDADYATMVAWPKSPAIDRWLAVFHAIAERNGADADAGRRLPSWLQAAGFVEIEMAATVELLADAVSAAEWGRSWAQRVRRSNFRAQAIAYGVATADEVEAIAAGWETWARHPEARFMFIQVQCLGRAP